MGWIFASILTLLQLIDGVLLVLLARWGVESHRWFTDYLIRKLGNVAGVMVSKLFVTGMVWGFCIFQSTYPPFLVVLYLMTVVYSAFILDNLSRMRNH